jgi:uroporphyrinogen-III decarboxylase
MRCRAAQRPQIATAIHSTSERRPPVLAMRAVGRCMPSDVAKKKTPQQEKLWPVPMPARQAQQQAPSDVQGAHTG